MHAFFNTIYVENPSGLRKGVIFPQKSSGGIGKNLEDHPGTGKWLIIMDNKSPKDRVVGPLPNGLNGNS